MISDNKTTGWFDLAPARGVGWKLRGSSSVLPRTEGDGELHRANIFNKRDRLSSFASGACCFLLAGHGGEGEDRDCAATPNLVRWCRDVRAVHRGNHQQRRFCAAVLHGCKGRPALEHRRCSIFFLLRRIFKGSIVATIVASPPSGYVPEVEASGREVKPINGAGGKGADCVAFHSFRGRVGKPRGLFVIPISVGGFYLIRATGSGSFPFQKKV